MRIILLSGLLLLCFLGCKDSNPVNTSQTGITITDHADTLTAGPGDTLFILTLTAAARSYAVASLMVDVKPAGGQATMVRFVLRDLNGDDSLNAGESLVCYEPQVDMYNASSAGQTYTVGISELTGSTYYQYAAGTWTVPGSAAGLEICGTWAGTWGSTSYTVVIQNTRLDYNDGMSATIISYNNTDNTMIIQWTSHPAFTGKYQKWHWLNEPQQAPQTSVTMEVYRELNTAAEAAADTIVKYANYTMTRQ